MDGLTINEAADTTGWSARMLRYIEREGLIEPRRSASGYRLYGPEELQRLRTLRELLADHDMSLGDAGFALRLSRDPDLEGAVEAWLEAEPAKPEEVPASEWLTFEQEKHQRLLAEAARDGDSKHSASVPNPSQDSKHSASVPNPSLTTTT